MISLTGNSDFPSRFKPMMYGSVCTNLWNLNSATGSVEIFGNRNECISFRIDLNDIQLKRNTITGYPEICYGSSLVSKPFNPSGTGCFSFPVSLLSLMDQKAEIVISYEIRQYFPSVLPFNLSLDIWILSDPREGKMPGDNDLELMIWIYRHIQTPIGKMERKLLSSADIDGTKRDVEWSVWSGKGNEWKTVSYIIDESFQREKNRVRIDLNAFLGDLHADEHKYMVMGVEFGSEFGSPDLPGQKLQWNLKEFSMVFPCGTIEMV
ncbi:MAG: hypothetical protein M1315_01925 [Candidatus Thermoplasmatota archaeon]|nr:hypothetical protein [Candidatus Thermoplasmatota archaeon]